MEVRLDPYSLSMECIIYQALYPIIPVAMTFAAMDRTQLVTSELWHKAGASATLPKWALAAQPNSANAATGTERRGKTKSKSV